MPLPTFPQEILDYIIAQLPEVDDSVRFDSPAMVSSQATALVCWSWLAPSRRNLFRSITLRLSRMGSCSQLLTLLDSGLEIESYIREIRWDLHGIDLEDPILATLVRRIYHITAVHNILHDVHVVLFRGFANDFSSLLDIAPELAAYVRETSWAYATDDSEWQVESLGALPLARRLSRVRTLRLCDTCTGFTSANHWDLLGQAFPASSITALHLDGPTFNTTADMRQFLSYFMHLDKLSLDEVNVDQSSGGMIQAPSIRRLTSRGHTFAEEAVMSWLSEQPQSSLERLRLLWPTPPTVHTANVRNRLLDHCRGTLRELLLVSEYTVM
jgi:hypothetical protein